MQDSDDNVVADAVFDFFGSIPRIPRSLSSKRKGMEAEGKTWNYHDILAQFITMHNKKSNVLLIWSGDWPTYSSNSDKYYVILAGEGFDSTDEAWNWCKANNYGPNDCMSIDLQ